MTGLTALIFVYGAVIAYLALRSDRATRRLSHQPWERLVHDLTSVGHDELARASALYVSYKQLGDVEEFDGLCEIIGGEERLRRIRANARILVKLALYCDTWSPQSSRVTVKKMADLELRIRWASARYAMFVKGRTLMDLNEGYPRASRCLAEISYSYCRMTDLLLTLYQETHIARYPQLRAACN